MIIHEFINSRNKKITIKLSNISDLFFYNADLYIKAFNISKSEFQNIKNFKTRYDGYYIKIKQNDELAAFFTLREFKINSYELGDLVKIKKLFHREDLAKGIKYTNDYILEKNQNATFIGYPNELALKVELDAGYKIYSYYRSISLIFCNFVLSLPILISNKRLNLTASSFLENNYLLIII